MFSENETANEASNETLTHQSQTQSCQDSALTSKELTVASKKLPNAVPESQQTQPLPEHIQLERAMWSYLYEHTYCKRKCLITLIVIINYDFTVINCLNCNLIIVAPDAQQEAGPPDEGVKERQLQSVTPNGEVKHFDKRKRTHSSSTSSSSSSSSSGSSSGSSSDSSGSDSEGPHEDNRHLKQNRKSAAERMHVYSNQSGSLDHQNIKILPLTPPVKRGRGRPKGSLNRDKFGVPTAKKFQVGQQSKRVARMVDEAYKPRKKFRKSKGKVGRPKASAAVDKGQENPLTETPTLPSQPESDFETDESGGEELFHRTQLTEPVDSNIPYTDRIWSISNEEYLLRLLRGVDSIEKLKLLADAKQKEEEEAAARMRLEVCAQNILQTLYVCILITHCISVCGHDL